MQQLSESEESENGFYEQIFHAQTDEPWYADIVNYLATGNLPSDMPKHTKDKIKKSAKYYVWDEPYLWKYCSDQMIRRCIPDQEIASVLTFCHSYSCGGHFGPRKTAHKILESGLFWPTIFRDAYLFCRSCARCQHTGNLSNRIPSWSTRYLMYEA